jgi:hypothetical protein
MSTAMVVMVASEKKSAGIGAVSAEANIAGMMDVTAIDPDFVAFTESKSMAAASNFNASQAKILHGT